MQKGIKWGIHKGNGNLIKENSLVAVVSKESSGADIVAFVSNDKKTLKLSGQRVGINYRAINNGSPDLILEETSDMGLDKDKVKEHYSMILNYVNKDGYSLN